MIIALKAEIISVKREEFPGGSIGGYICVVGIGVFVGIIILVVLFGWIGAIIGWFIIGFTANRTYESFLITKGYTSQNIRSHKKKFRKKK